MYVYDYLIPLDVRADEYERGDSNPHAKKALDPKSSASTNSATLALLHNFRVFCGRSKKPKKLRFFDSVFNKLLPVIIQL